MFRLTSKFLLFGLLVVLTVSLFGQNNWDQQRQMQQQQLALQRQRAEQQRQMQQQREQQRQQMLAQQRQQREAMRQQQLQQQRAQQEAMRQQQRAQQEQMRQQQRLQQQQLRMQQQQTRQQQMADRQRQIQQNRNTAAAQQQQQRRNIAADLIRSRNAQPSAGRQTAQQAFTARQQQIQQSKTTQAAIDRARQLTLNRQNAAIQQQRVQAQARQNLTQQKAKRVQAKTLADRARLIATQRGLLSSTEAKQAQAKQFAQSKVIATLASKKNGLNTANRAPLPSDVRKNISNNGDRIISQLRTRYPAARTEIAPAKRESGTTVLGHYPDYADMADDLGHRRFNIPQEIWEGMTDDQRWAANEKFLERTISRGDEIVLATPLDKMKSGDSWYRKEIEYLKSKGYTPNIDGTKMLPPRK